jgi:hypothetical protein
MITISFSERLKAPLYKLDVTISYNQYAENFNEIRDSKRIYFILFHLLKIFLFLLNILNIYF